MRGVVKLKDATIAWTPGKEIRVIEKGKPALDWELTTEANLEGDEAKIYISTTALKMIRRYGFRQGQVYQQFRKIDEFRAALKKFKL